MFKLITKDGAARHSRWNLVLCPDPDELLRLARQHADGEVTDRDAFADAFSRAVSGIRIGRTWKFTHRGRLAQSTERLVEALRSLGFLSRAGASEDADAEQLHLLDVGASDGITTLEALELLRQQLGCEIRATLFDKFTSIVRVRCRWRREYRTRDGTPLMVRLGPLVLRLNDSTPVQTLAGRAYAAWTRFRQDDPRCQTISLVNPLVAADPAMEVVEGNVLVHQPQFSKRFTVVRAANVLYRGTFGPAEISLAIAHLHDYLVDGGVLLVSRNPHEANPQAERGSFWRKRNGQFELVDEFGGGAEIADLVKQFTADCDAPVAVLEKIG